MADAMIRQSTGLEMPTVLHYCSRPSFRVRIMTGPGDMKVFYEGLLTRHGLVSIMSSNTVQRGTCCQIEWFIQSPAREGSRRGGGYLVANEEDAKYCAGEKIGKSAGDSSDVTTGIALQRRSSNFFPSKKQSLIHAEKRKNGGKFHVRIKARSLPRVFK